MTAKAVRRTVSAAVMLVALALLVAFCRSGHTPYHTHWHAHFPPPLAEEVEEIVRGVASGHGVHLHAQFKGRPNNSDGLEALSLWVRPSEEATKLWFMTLSRDYMRLSVGVYEVEGVPAELLDSLAREVEDGLEGLGLTLCDVDRMRSFCVRPAQPRLLHLMGFANATAEEPGQFIYDLAARHGVRIVQPGRIESVAGAENLFETRLFLDYRAFHRGEFLMLLTNAPSGDQLRLSVFDRGEMAAEDLDALVRDAKATLEAEYGRPFCRANPATWVCDAAHAELERQLEAWLRARDAGAERIEVFLAADPDSPHADAARERLALLRRLAEPPPPAPAALAAPWLGRRPSETFADALPDGSSGPLMTVAPAGVFEMGCASAAGCRLEELPRHPVRVARPFALSTREVTHAEYFRFARPDKRLDPTWADRPATHLTWAEAAGYAEWLSERTGAAYRLPSEAEWEWAARAGTETAYSWGAEMEGGRARCHECPWPQPSGIDVFGRRLRMVWVAFAGSYAPNGWGFHEMHGNAAEWTADCWRPNHLGAPPDGSARTDGDCRLRVVRGGSYETPPHAIRSAARAGRAAGERYMDVGFRVLRELRNAPAWDGD